MNTNVATPVKVAIIGANGTYGQGILARAEAVGVEAVVVTRSPHMFQDVKATTRLSVLKCFGVDLLEQNEWDKLSPHVSSGPQPRKK